MALVGRLILALFCVACVGCVVAAGAAVGAGVVYAVSEDTVRVDVSADRDAVLSAAERTLEERGEITSSLRRTGALEATVANSSVRVNVFQVESYVRVRVSARRIVGVFPNRELAEEIASDIRHSFP